MRILATGGAGYVGSATVRMMLQQGMDVLVYDNLSKGHRAALPEGVLIEGDLADRDTLISVMKDRRIDAVMHFAASIAVGESVANPRHYYRNNVANSLTLLEAMQDAGVEKILFSSTAAVYAPSDKPLTEQAPKDPDSPYAFSKWAIERMIQDFARAYGFGYVILRYFNACGGSGEGRFGEDHRPETHLIPLVLQVPLGRRKQISVFGDNYDTPDGTCIRDYIHVEDLADAHIRAVKTLTPGQGRVYNIGTGTGHSVLEVIKTAEKVVGQKIPYQVVARRDGDTTRLVASADTLRKDLGWQPRYDTLEAIIASAWQWHQSHPAGYAD